MAHAPQKRGPLYFIALTIVMAGVVFFAVAGLLERFF
jgi:hypothetical protein